MEILKLFPAVGVLIPVSNQEPHPPKRKIMAHLEVEPKPSKPWWVWLLIVLLLILLAGMLLKKCNSESADTNADSTTMDSTQTTQ